jgi:tRNA-specific 2-thiouridylase
MTKSRIAVALSGGLDSAVAASLLKDAGHKIEGIHMQVWDSPASQYQRHQAEALCSRLGIHFRSVDLRGEFDHHVVEYFRQEYRRGRTPNPCVVCNRDIKFGILLERALSSGADYLATGHYARVEHSNGGYRLLKATDASKDQSYFLYTLTQERLAHVLFPLGSYLKDEAGPIAARKGLPVAKPSRDICFVSRSNYRSFLRRHSADSPCQIVDSRGEILGQHQGAGYCTIGQRHGLGVATGRPLYVIRIEPEGNRIVLGSERQLYSQTVGVAELGWVAGNPPLEHLSVAGKIRYRSREAEASLSVRRDRGEVRFARAQRAVTPGQAIVFYRGEEVLGGGTIESSEPLPEDENGE